LRLLATLIISLATWALVRYGWSQLVVLYGRRRFAVTVLTGFVLNAALTQAAFLLPAESLELRAVGYIVPGLIANTALTQGPVATVGITMLVAAIVRAILMVVARA
jgi:poly-gamma-glutamate biosynthesis protein PgsC/CapC